MDLIIYFFIFIFGCFLGSFLNVVVDRLPKGESVIVSRSHCEHCRHKLVWYDLIPLLSFLMIKGKCRYCEKQLSSYYPFVELSTGVAFVFISFFILRSDLLLKITESSYLITIIFLFSVVSTLIIIFFTDLKYGIIPFKVVSFAVAVTLLWYFSLTYLKFPTNEFVALWSTGNILLNHIFSALGVVLFFLTLFLITKGRGLGFGDVVYVFLMGLLLGFPKIILGLYIAFIGGAVISLLLVLLKIKKFSGGTIPFGPFLVAGTLLAMFWGNVIIDRAMSYL